MSWILIAFGAPILYAISTHIDKHIVERYFKNVDPAVLLTPSFSILVLPTILYLHPQALDIFTRDALIIAFSGVLYLVGLLFYLRALQKDDASVVSPLFQTIPLFGFVLGYFLLQELPTFAQTIGGLILLGGSALLSIDFGSRHRRIKKTLVVQMLIAAFVLASSAALFKFIASDYSFWTMIFWSGVGEVTFGFLLLLYPPYFKQFLTFFTRERAGIWVIGTINEGINLMGVWCGRLALLFAPLSLVQAINSTTPVFVFIIGVLLALFIPRYGKESLNRTQLVQRFLAIVGIVVGTVIIGA